MILNVNSFKVFLFCEETMDLQARLLSYSGQLSLRVWLVRSGGGMGQGRPLLVPKPLTPISVVSGDRIAGLSPSDGGGSAESAINSNTRSRHSCPLDASF